MSDWVRFAKIGDKVACVRDDYIAEVRRWLASRGVVCLPTKGEVYTVRGFEDYQGETFVLLDELRNPAIRYCDRVAEQSFPSRYFRPVQPRKTDIGIFEKLLQSAPADQHVRENA